MFIKFIFGVFRMHDNKKWLLNVSSKHLSTFIAIALFYFFESAQMSYFNVLAPTFLSHGIYQHSQIASLSAAYYYGCMIGLIPVGLALDHFPLRKILLWAILGSVIGAFILPLSGNFYLQWVSRFICGFFGGAFSFVGGIRVLANIFPKRFTFFMGLFLSAGMFGGLVSQYPLLMAVNHIGAKGAMAIMTGFGLIVIMTNFFYLHPDLIAAQPENKNQFSGNTRQMITLILKNYRNWLDCFMIVLLDTPVSIIGTLWGVVILMNCYHFSDVTSAWVVMALFVGLMVGLPAWGELADRYNYPAWIIVAGSGASLAIIILMLVFTHPGAWFLAFLFFCLGLFSSCQTLGFTWLTKNMRPELIGRNSAFNSMIFMGTNGGFKQIGAYLLSTVPLIVGSSSASNLLLLIGAAMLLTTVYACVRNKFFDFFSSKSPITQLDY